jgi:hypothetical protein
MEVTQQTNSKSRKIKTFDYKGALIHGATIVAQGALFALGSSMASRLAMPRVKGAPELMVVGKEEAPLSIRKTAGNA